MTNVQSLGPDRPAPGVALATIAREWGRIGCIGFGGPPTHIALLRRLCVERAAVDAAQRVRGRDRRDQSAARSRVDPAGHLLRLAAPRVGRGAWSAGCASSSRTDRHPGPVGGVPGHPPARLGPRGRRRRRGSRAGRGGPGRIGLVPASWERIGPAERSRPDGWSTPCSAAPPRPRSDPTWCSCSSRAALVEVARPTANGDRPDRAQPAPSLPCWSRHGAAAGGLGALAWVAFKVGALSYGGGFVIIPLMQHDAVHDLPLDDRSPVPQRRRPRPGHSRPRRPDGRRGRLRRGRASAAGCSPRWWPSPRRSSSSSSAAPASTGSGPSLPVQAFLTGAGPAVVGAIAGSAIPLGLALSHLWQLAVLALSGIWLIALRKGVVLAIVGGGIAGAIAALAGAPVSP